MDDSTASLSRHSATSSRATFERGNSPEPIYAWQTASYSILNPQSHSTRSVRTTSSTSSSRAASPTMQNTPPLSSKRSMPCGLPELTEDPSESESKFDLPLSPVSPRYPQQTRWSTDSPRTPLEFSQYSRRSADAHDFSGASDVYVAKRRRSGEYSWNGFANGLRSTFGSFSKRSRHSKRASAPPSDAMSRFSPPPSPSPTHTAHGSRSASRARSVRGSTETERVGQHIDTIMEDESREDDVIQTDSFLNSHLSSQFTDGADGMEPRSRTPLLPSFLDNQSAGSLNQLVQSPLQSPVVVANSSGTFSTFSSNAIDTPGSFGMMTPPLSQKPSVASFHRSRASTGVNTSDIPPLFITESADEWAELLGHANFLILPEPYDLEQCDAKSCEQFVSDWKQARSEYAKHRSRTELHFGASSRIYKHTEDKWATIEAEWKASSARVSRRAIESGETQGSSPVEPAPPPVIPHLDDPRIVRNEEIVGPMEILPVPDAASSNTHRLSRKDTFLKLLGPKTRLGRSFSMTRPY